MNLSRRFFPGNTPEVWLIGSIRTAMVYIEENHGSSMIGNHFRLPGVSLGVSLENMWFEGIIGAAGLF